MDTNTNTRRVILQLNEVEKKGRKRRTVKRREKKETRGRRTLQQSKKEVERKDKKKINTSGSANEGAGGRRILQFLPLHSGFPALLHVPLQHRRIRPRI